MIPGSWATTHVEAKSLLAMSYRIPEANLGAHNAVLMGPTRHSPRQRISGYQTCRVRSKTSAVAGLMSSTGMKLLHRVPV